MEHVLTHPAPTDEALLKRCLALTGSFETAKGAPDCFSGLAGDFDGMGLSFGALQWNLGQKTLQPMLQEIFASHPDRMKDVFGDGFHALGYMLALPCAAQLEWARSIQEPHRHSVNEPWKSRFIALGQTEEFQAIQLSRAEQMYQDALGLCARFSLNTERGLALMFDIRVQNGGINPHVEAKIRADYDSIMVSHAFRDGSAIEGARLQAIANRRAEAANPNFVEDVRGRKLTIARGEGKVHGVNYDLERQFGIRLVARNA